VSSNVLYINALKSNFSSDMFVYVVIGQGYLLAGDGTGARVNRPVVEIDSNFIPVEEGGVVNIWEWSPGHRLIL
jgi:hypothetical protein